MIVADLVHDFCNRVTFLFTTKCEHEHEHAVLRFVPCCRIWRVGVKSRLLGGFCVEI